ncbi:MAG: hypothetical protein FJ217_07945 [Ignavibacteria bacterium]|nr:hypothetical protein [Ignavibacteria bacterium]
MMTERIDVRQDQDPPALAGATTASRHPLRDTRPWLLCAMLFVVGLLMLNDTMLYTPDSPRYVVWAKSLAALEGYKDDTSPDVVRYVVHAPLYPLMLAPLAWFFSNIIIPAKILTLLTGLCLIALFYFWVAPSAGRIPALLGSFLLALNPLVILFSTHVLSDVPFAVTVVLFFVFARKLSGEPDNDRYAWLLVAVVTLGIFLREVGLTLLAAAASYFMLRKDRRRFLMVITIPVLFYLIWYFRNDIFVASVENPPMRNTQLFFAHYFTVQDAGLEEEFLARMSANASVYFEMAKALVFFPQYVVRPFPVVASVDPLMGLMAAILRHAQYPIALLQFGLFGWGVVVAWKKEKSGLLFLLFLFFYLSLILLYPFNDIRFLVPLLLVLLYYGALACGDLYKRYLAGRVRQVTLAAVSSAACFLLSVPNMVWSYNAILHNHTYHGDVASSFREFRPSRENPELYSKPFSMVGKWIAENSDSSTTVAGRWKELAFWLEGRKLLEVEPLIPLSLLETILRDHRVGFLVVLVSNPGIRELEFQMQQSRKFTFETAYRVGNLEVVEVFYQPLDLAYAKAWPGAQTRKWVASEADSQQVDEEQKVRSLYRLGIRLLESGEYERGAGIFQVLWGVTGGSGGVVLFRAIALEFMGKTDEAQQIFDRFRNQPQAGPFLKHAWYHTQLMAHIRQADEDTAQGVKSMIYHMVSANYWDLGFRYRANEMLSRSLETDSAFSPALVFGCYYALQQAEYNQAKSYLARLKVVDPRHLMVSPLQSLFHALDSLRSARNVKERVNARLSVARLYASMGLAELAIDQVLLVLKDDPRNAEGLKGLADLYEQKRRNAPAIRVLNQLLEVEPSNALARARRDSLVSLW